MEFLKDLWTGPSEFIDPLNCLVYKIAVTLTFIILSPLVLIIILFDFINKRLTKKEDLKDLSDDDIYE